MAIAKCLSTREAAEYLRVSESYLHKARHFGTGPEFRRISSRCIRYRPEDLDAWTAERRATSTADYGPEAA